MQISWQGDGLAPARRFEHWREAVCQAILNVATERPADPQRFSASIRARSYDGLRVAGFEASSHEIVRTSRHISQSDSESVLISLQRRGRSSMDQGGKDCDLAPGEIGVLDGELPFRVRLAGPVRRTLVVLPRRQLMARAPGLGRSPCLKVTGRTRYGALARRHILELANGDHSDRAAWLLADNLCNLLALALGDGSSPAARRADLETILAYCRGRLNDPDLGPRAVAERFGVSVRTLHLRFESEGRSFGRWLTEARLDACRLTLADPAQASRTIAAVAFSHGFNELSSFNRAFRARFGRSPSDMRRDRQAEAGPGDML